MVLPFDNTHDIGLVISRSKFEIAIFEEWGGGGGGDGVGGWVLIDMEQKGCEFIIHDRNLWVTMAGWVNVPYSDLGDFRCRRAVDISSLLCLASAVRYGRVPKRSKSLDDQRVSTTEGRQEQSELENRQLAIYDIILTISQAHHANCMLTEDKIKNLVRRPITLVSGRRLFHSTVSSLI